MGIYEPQETNKQNKNSEVSLSTAWTRVAGAETWLYLFLTLALQPKVIIL